MGERQTLLFRASPSFEGWKKDYSRITTEIQNPVSLEDILDGTSCSACGRAVSKTYIAWEFPSDFDDKGKLIVTVGNTAGYKCADNCAMEWPSNIGLLQTIDQAIPIFQDKGFRNTVNALEWTKQVLLEIVTPSNQNLNEVKN